MEKKKINYICSLGNQCHPAKWCKMMNLKKCSFPFDWVLSNEEIIIDCIKNDFVQFLDRNLHIKSKRHPKSNTKSGHKIYGGKMFNHHNILLDEDYNYFCRCVDRFRKLMKKDKKKLFIICNENNTSPEINARLNQKLYKLYETIKLKTKNFEFLVIYHIIGNKTDSQVIDDLKLNNFKIIKITTKNRSKGVRIRDRFENKFWNKCISDLYDYNIIDDI